MQGATPRSTNSATEVIEKQLAVAEIRYTSHEIADEVTLSLHLRLLGEGASSNHQGGVTDQVDECLANARLPRAWKSTQNQDLPV